MLELYKNRELKRSVYMELEGYIFNGWNIKEDLKLKQSVNVGEDYTIGSFVVSELLFNVIDLNSNISENSLANQSFIYKMGIEVERLDVFNIWKLYSPDLLCIKENTAYCIKNSELIAYDITTGELIENIKKPSIIPLCLVIIEDKLYCGDSTVMDEYSLIDNKPEYTKSISLNGFEGENIGYLIKENKALFKQSDFITEYEFDYFDLKPVGLVAIKSQFKDIGKFIVKQAKRTDGLTVKITALDYGDKFNQIIDNVLNKINYPATPLEIVAKICEHFGVGLKPYQPINAGFKLETTIKSKNITGRAFIQWTAELFSCVAIVNNENQLEFLNYSEVDYKLTADDYFNPPTVFEYETQNINKLVVEIPTKNDIAEVENGQNVYRINANPFFITDSESSITPYLIEIYNKLKAVSYRPYEVKGVGNPNIKVGDIITLVTLDNKEIKAYIMERTMEGIFGLTDTYMAVGRINRIETASQNAVTESIIGNTVNPDESADKYINDVNSTADISIGTTAIERALLMVLSKDAHVFLNLLMTSTASAQGVVTVLIKLGGVLFYTYKQAVQQGDFTIGFEFPLWQISKGENRVSVEITSTVPFVIAKFNFNMWLRSKGIVGGKSDKYPAIDVTEQIGFIKLFDSVIIELQVPSPVELPEAVGFIELSDEVGAVITESEEQ